jgi:hypothetical protein
MNKIKNIKLEDIIVRKSELDSVDMDGEVVMMNIEKGTYYGFNSVGSNIWELIHKPIAVKNIIDKLLNEFDIDSNTCEDSVIKFINGLYEEELITLC